MKNKYVFLLMSFIAFTGYTQGKRITIKGQIISDSGSTENIHIINKSSKKAVITDLSGVFEIPVQQTDTLLFSSVHFENTILIITETHMDSLRLVVNLNATVNKLGEVAIKNTENVASDLGLPNAEKKPLTKLEGRLNYHTTASLPIAILAAILNKRGGIDDMYYIISGKRKKDRKLKKLIEDDTFKLYQLQQIQKIRRHFKDTFFTETLHLQSTEIEHFIQFCDEHSAVISLFAQDKKLEVIDIFMKTRKKFKE